MAVELAFWLFVATVAYVYVGYPVLLASTSLTARTTSRAAGQTYSPTVTLVISAYNEADCIADKLDNTLALEYPKDLLEIIVDSDASDDGTDDIVHRYADRGVRLIRMPQRGGKTIGLNEAVAQSKGEIIVFSDANALYYLD